MAELNVGKPDVSPDGPSHVKGVYQGNARGNYERQPGHRADGKRTAQSATGINARAREPIDPRMPNLPPA